LGQKLILNLFKDKVYNIKKKETMFIVNVIVMLLTSVSVTMCVNVTSTINTSIPTTTKLTVAVTNTPNNTNNTPTSKEKTPCNIEGQYFCGQKNDMGQDTIIQCSNGLLVKIADCDEPGDKTCRFINGLPFCVA
jgi:hypothetical protein